MVFVFIVHKNSTRWWYYFIFYIVVLREESVEVDDDLLFDYRGFFQSLLPTRFRSNAYKPRKAQREVNEYIPIT